MEIHVIHKTDEQDLFPSGLSSFEINIPEIKVRQYLDLPFDDLHRYFGADTPEGVDGDLLVVCGTCYVVDQLVARSLFADNWTRELGLTIPVENPELWNKAASQLNSTLARLTGDHWHILFSQRHAPIYHHRHRKLNRRQLHPAAAVNLFSGGLDSFIGAVDFLESHDESLTLVGHFDLGSRARIDQANLAKQLDKAYPWRINVVQARIGRVQSIQLHKGIFGNIQNPQNFETTFRSRSIVFLALGLYAARRHSTEFLIPLHIPENGLISFNPPLTPARSGSCSTKTTDPQFLAQFQAVMKQLGIENQISNPFLAKTKGEIVAQAQNQNLVHELFNSTVSCAHPTRRQGWHRKRGYHCGYCVPCLFRRAALHKVGLDDGTDYGYDVWLGELGLTETIASDLRAVLSWIYDAHYAGRTAQYIVNRMSIPEEHQTAALHVVDTGLNEMTQIIRDKADMRIKRWAGLETL